MERGEAATKEVGSLYSELRYDRMTRLALADQAGGLGHREKVTILVQDAHRGLVV